MGAGAEVVYQRARTSISCARLLYHLSTGFGFLPSLPFYRLLAVWRDPPFQRPTLCQEKQWLSLRVFLEIM